MKPRIYKVKQGYDIVTSKGELYTYTTTIRYKGKVDLKKWQPSGVLVKNIPNHLKQIFFQLQQNDNTTVN